MPFSQEAQLTGPTYFLVNIASSSLGMFVDFISKSYKFLIYQVSSKMRYIKGNRSLK